MGHKLFCLRCKKYKDVSTDPRTPMQQKADTGRKKKLVACNCEVPDMYCLTCKKKH